MIFYAFQGKGIFLREGLFTLLTLHASLLTFSPPPHPDPQPFGIQSHSARSSPVRTSIPQGERENILLNKPFNLSTFQLFNYLHSSLSPHFVILSLRIFGRVKQSGTRKVRVGRYSARTPNNPR